jgi:hypothetical protein
MFLHAGRAFSSDSDFGRGKELVVRVVTLLSAPLDGSLFDLGDPAVVVHFAHEESPTHMHKDGAFVRRKDGATRLDFLDDLVLAAGDIDDRIMFVLRVPDRNCSSGTGLVPRVAMVEAVVVADQPTHADLPQLVFVAVGKVFRVFDRVDGDLVGSALDVRLENDRIIEVEIELLERTGKDEIWIPRVVLVEGERVADEHRQRVLVAATCTPGLLPEARERVREADCDDRVETADIDSELECGRRDDSQKLAVEHLLLNLAPVLSRSRVSYYANGTTRCACDAPARCSLNGTT